jgi:hypothetical protein
VFDRSFVFNLPMPTEGIFEYARPKGSQGHHPLHQGGNHLCGGRTDPNSDEVFIYKDGDYKSTCAALSVGWYPNPGTGTYTFGLGNDSISPYKVGRSVRARFFTDVVYGGDWIFGFGNSSYIGDSWNDLVSSMRVEWASRSPDCNDLNPGEFALYTPPNPTTFQSSDCVVLTYPSVGSYGEKVYADPVHMGIANDLVSYVRSGPATSIGSLCSYLGGNWSITLYKHANSGGTAYSIVQGTGVNFLYGTPLWVQASSVTAKLACNIP